MSTNDRSQSLLFEGALLVFLGLASGAAIPAMESARLGLAAHLAGVQGGMLVILIGIVWGRLNLSPSQATTAFVATPFANYALFIALQLAALWGTNRSTPIAGAGASGGSALQEATVDGLLFAGSLSAFVAVGLVAWGLRPSAKNS